MGGCGTELESKKKEEFSSNQNFFIVEKYIIAYSIVDFLKYLEFIEFIKEFPCNIGQVFKEFQTIIISKSPYLLKRWPFFKSLVRVVKYTQGVRPS